MLINEAFHLYYISDIIYKISTVSHINIRLNINHVFQMKKKQIDVTNIYYMMMECISL